MSEEKELKEVVVDTTYDTSTHINHIVKESDGFDQNKVDEMYNKFVNGENVDIEAELTKLYKDNPEINKLQEVVELANIVKQYKAGKISSKYYDKLPSSIKAEIFKQVSSAAMLNGSRVNKQVLNFGAKAFLEDLCKEVDGSSSFDIDEMFNELYKGIKDNAADAGKSSGDLFLSTIEDRKASIEVARQKAKENNDLEALKKFDDMERDINKSYDLVEFREALPSIKIKKFYLEKPSKVFDDFNYKFNSSKYPINNIAHCPAILEKHGISPENAVKLCVAFCLYCQNMKAENSSEYLFMYYFIRNIIILDRLNYDGANYDKMEEKAKNYYDGFLANLKSCIESFR